MCNCDKAAFVLSRNMSSCCRYHMNTVPKTELWATTAHGRSPLPDKLISLECSRRSRMPPTTTTCLLTRLHITHGDRDFTGLLCMEISAITHSTQEEAKKHKQESLIKPFVHNETYVDANTKAEISTFCKCLQSRAQLKIAYIEALRYPAVNSRSCKQYFCKAKTVAINSRQPLIPYMWFTLHVN